MYTVSLEGITLKWSSLGPPEDSGKVTMEKPPQAHRTAQQQLLAEALEDFFHDHETIPRYWGTMISGTWPVDSWFGLIRVMESVAESMGYPEGGIQIEGPRPPAPPDWLVAPPDEAVV